MHPTKIMNSKSRHESCPMRGKIAFPRTIPGKALFQAMYFFLKLRHLFRMHLSEYDSLLFDYSPIDFHEARLKQSCARLVIENHGSDSAAYNNFSLHMPPPLMHLPIPTIPQITNFQ